MIPFNKQHLFGNEFAYIQDAYDEAFQVTGNIRNLFLEGNLGSVCFLLIDAHALELALSSISTWGK